MYGEPITITITINQNIKKAYYYYYYFTDYYYYYYFLIIITFIITVELKKHNTIRLQSNIQRPLLLLLLADFRGSELFYCNGQDLLFLM